MKTIYHLLHVATNDILPEEGRDTGNIRLASTAHHKFIRGCHYRGTAVKQSPKSVNWLLAFANIGSKSGELFPEKVACLPIIKRPPVDPASLVKNPFQKEIDGVSSMLSADEKSYIEKVLNKHLIKDENDNVWTKLDDGIVNYRGKLNSFPAIEVFRQFTSNTNVNIDSQILSTQREHIHYILCWQIARYSILSKMDFGNGVDVSGYTTMVNTFILDHYKFPCSKGKKYKHDNTLLQVTCSHIQDIFYHHRELHQYFKQCECCGKFWLRNPDEESRGRKKKYCSDVCADRFNQPSKESNKKSKESSARHKKERAKKEIIN